MSILSVLVVHALCEWCTFLWFPSETIHAPVNSTKMDKRHNVREGTRLPVV